MSVVKVRLNCYRACWKIAGLLAKAKTAQNSGHFVNV